METIGKIVDGIIYKEYDGQGYIYKNYEAFESDSDDICYIPELSGDSDVLEENTYYRKSEFIELVQGFYDTNEDVRDYMDKENVSVEDLAKELFYAVDWQHPETLLDDWEQHRCFTY